MTEWVRVAELTEVNRRKKKLVEIGEERIALFSAGGSVFALQDSCVHKQRQLSRGTVLDGKVVCPGHQWVFDLGTGRAGDREECQPTYPVKVQDGQVWVLPERRRTAPEAAGPGTANSPGTAAASGATATSGAAAAPNAAVASGPPADSPAASGTAAAPGTASGPAGTGEGRAQPRHVLVVGAGQTAAVAVRTLRRKGFAGRITVVGDEPHPPYQRPPLTKEFLSGEEDRDSLTLLAPSWCEENGVELRLGAPVRRIHAAPAPGEDGAAELEDGTRIPADAFLLATGASARRIPGIAGDRVVHLRRIEDAERLRSLLRPEARVVIVGAGFVGSEVASAARSAGASVTVLEQAEVPLERVLGARVGEVVARIQRKAGVELHTGEAVTSYDETAQGAVVTTASGLRVEGDVVVVAVGAVPETGVAERSGVAVSNGILVDEHCRTNLPGVYAAGDVADQQHPLFERRLRVEHFDNASRQATTAARNILGEDVVHDDPHWFWSDQFDLGLQQCGHTEDTDELVVRGSVEAADFTAFYLAGGVLRAAFAIGRGGDVLAAKELIAHRCSPDPEALRDEDTDLRSLLPDEAAAQPETGTPDRPASAPGGEQPEPAAEQSASPTGPAHTAVGAPDGEAARPYVRVARSGQVPEGVVRRFFVDGTELAVARRGGTVHVSSNYCTHLDCLLSSGKVTQEGLLCSCHGSVFDFATGEPLSPPATEPIRVHPSKEENGEILVALDPETAASEGPRRRRR